LGGKTIDEINKRISPNTYHIPPDWKEYKAVGEHPAMTREGITPENASEGLCHVNTVRNYKKNGLRVASGVVIYDEYFGKPTIFDKPSIFDKAKDVRLREQRQKNIGKAPITLVINHHWNLDQDGRVVDSTLGSKEARNVRYFGHEITDKKYLNNADRLFDENVDELDKFKKQYKKLLTK
jgi:hypothetical protein